jgi:hypothetical protein
MKYGVACSRNREVLRQERDLAHRKTAPLFFFFFYCYTVFGIPNVEIHTLLLFKVGKRQKRHRVAVDLWR